MLRTARCVAVVVAAWVACAPAAGCGGKADGPRDDAGAGNEVVADGASEAVEDGAGDGAVEVDDANPEAGDPGADPGDGVEAGDEAGEEAEAAIDECPDDPDKTVPGACGCGIPDTPNCAEIEPPRPDPPGWAQAPRPNGTGAIAMRAGAVTDPSGVEYYFECGAGPCHDSGWQESDVYEDAGLVPDAACTYRVKARDRSPNRNETGWSQAAAARTDRDPGYAAGLVARFFDFADALPGMPDLAGRTADLQRIDAQIDYPSSTQPWAGLPAGFADTFASRHGGFLRVAQPGDYVLFLGTDGGARLWLDGEPRIENLPGEAPSEGSAAVFLAAGYHPIRVDFFRDVGPAALVLSWTGPQVARHVVPATALYHADPPDALPPEPGTAQWETPPAPTGIGSVAMTAAPALDPCGVQYLFECVQGPGHDSGWQAGRTFEDSGLLPGTAYAWRVWTRDLSIDDNASGPSEARGCRTDAVVPDVTGRSLGDAQQALREAGLEAGGVRQGYSETVPAGAVIEQEPVAGEVRPAGTPVDLVVSLGPERHQVPDVVGQARDAAAQAIEGASLAVGAVTQVFDCAVAPGTVMQQTPAGGAMVPRDTPVALVVSGGSDRVVISEILYHPATDPAREEFLELANLCPQPAMLEGWMIQGLGGYTFGPGAVIEANGYVVLAEDEAVFEAACGFAPDFVYPDASLSNGGELLRLTAPDGRVVDEVAYDDVPPWPVTPDGLGPSMEVVDPSMPNDTPRNWHASIAPSGSTPRAINSVDAEGLPPWITGVGHGTALPDLPIGVTATVQEATQVSLEWVLDWGVPAVLPMLDDGHNGDGEAGDDVYGAILPGQPEGALVRYRLDAVGPTGAMGFPRDDDTVRYAGTYLAPGTTSDLDAFHWLIEPAAYARALEHLYTDLTEPALLFHGGDLYEGVQVRVRGQSSRGWPKKHWNFRFAQGHPFEDPAYLPGPVNGFNLQSSYADKTYLREILSYEAFQAAGCPSHVIRPVVVHQNGAFFGLYDFLEDADTSYLERNGLDPEGGLYKAFGSQCTYDPELPLEGPWEKESPGDGDFSELYDFLIGLNTLAGQERRDFLFGNVDIPAMLNYQAVSVLIHNNDQVAKNYFLYRDTKGTGRWSMQPWDMDLTFGRSFQGKVLNDRMFADVDFVPDRPNVSPSHPLFGDSEHQKWDYLWNRLTDALLKQPDVRQMYYRRLRTLMDQMLVPGRFEARIDELASRIEDEAGMDRQKWGWYGEDETPAVATARLKQEYLEVRRAHLFATHRIEGGIPKAQSPEPHVLINELMYNPYADPSDPEDAAGRLEFIELYNFSPTEAVDVSGWQVTGVDLAIPPGAVILPVGYLLVVRDDAAFRRRYGPGLFVAAQYPGGLAGGGERVALLDRDGKVVDEVAYDDNAPWPKEPDGYGPSLELRHPALDNSLPASWAASTVAGGTPGARNSVF